MTSGENESKNSSNKAVSTLFIHDFLDKCASDNSYTDRSLQENHLREDEGTYETVTCYKP
jgi:hypothetical protein